MKIESFADKMNKSNVIFQFNGSLVSVVGKALMPLIMSVSLYAANGIGSSDSQFTVSDKEKIKESTNQDRDPFYFMFNASKEDQAIVSYIEKYKLHKYFSPSQSSVDELKNISSEYMEKYNIKTVEEAIKAYAEDKKVLETIFSTYQDKISHFDIVEENNVPRMQEYFELFVKKIKEKNPNAEIERDSTYLALSYYVYHESIKEEINKNNLDNTKMTFYNINSIMKSYDLLRIENEILKNFDIKGPKSNLMIKLNELGTDKKNFILENESALLLLKALGEGNFNDFNEKELKDEVKVLNKFIINTSLSFPEEIEYEKNSALFYDIKTSIMLYEQEYLKIINMYLKDNSIDERTLENEFNKLTEIKREEYENKREYIDLTNGIK